jgi:hypothetical protein
MSASSQRRLRFARRGSNGGVAVHPEVQVDRRPLLTQASLIAELSEDLLIAEVERRLTNKYAHIPTDQVSTAVQRVYAQFGQSPIRDFVPLLVERRASAELATLKEPVAAAAST